MKRQRNAIKIQASFRGYSVRKKLIYDVHKEFKRIQEEIDCQVPLQCRSLNDNEKKRFINLLSPYEELFLTEEDDQNLDKKDMEVYDEKIEVKQSKETKESPREQLRRLENEFEWTKQALLDRLKCLCEAQ